MGILDTIKRLITKRNFTSMSNKQNRFIVIHYVGAVSSAYNNAKYFETIYRGASAHYFVDEKDIYQVVEDKNAAWHCGASYYKHLSCRNSNSIGIEMCCFNNKGKLDVSAEVERRTIELTKELMKKYNIPAENVIRHYDVTGKNCPAPLVSDNNRWVRFKEKLQQSKVELYKQGDFVETDIPVIWTGAQEGDYILVDSNGYQFWIHKSFVKNNRIIERAQICFVYSKDLYMIQVYDRQFNCKSEYITKKL